MFVVVPLKDVVVVGPSSLSLDHHAVVYRDVDLRYTGKVLHGLGVVIGVFDIPKISAAELKQGLQGSAEITVNFRLIVFQPLVGEVLLARITHSTSTALHVSLPFIDVPIVIPPSALQPTSEWDAVTSRWVWHYADEDEAGEDGENVSLLPYAHGTTIRVRVTSVNYDQSPSTITPGQRVVPVAGKAASAPESKV